MRSCGRELRDGRRPVALRRAAPALAALLLINLLAACASSPRQEPPPPAGPPMASPSELPVRRIPLTGPAALREAELSGLAWHGDDLILLPQYPERFIGPDDEGSAFLIGKERLLAFLGGQDPEPIAPRRIAFSAPGLRDSIPGYEGFEAMALHDGRAYFLVEGHGDERMTAYLLRGRIAPDGSRLVVEPSPRAAIPAQSRVANMSYEAIVVLADRVAVLSEVSGALANPEPTALLFDFDLRPLGTVPSPAIEYRVTDATEADPDGRLWVINYSYPGDRGLEAEVDSLVDEWGAGATHKACRAVERLVEYRISGDRIVRARRAPLQLELAGDLECRNWEGIARLDDFGFLLATDTYPETILAFVALPGAPAWGPDSEASGGAAPADAAPPGAVQAETGPGPRFEGPLPEPAEIGRAISADGVSIHWESYGRGSPALVFVHCWACDSRFWGGQLVPMARHHQIVTLDLAGHGRSDGGRREWTVEAFAGDVAAVVRALNLQQIVLVGHSMGGPVAIETARLLPGRVAGLIAIDSLQDVEQRPTDEQIEEFLARLRHDFPAGIRAFGRAALFPADADSSVVAWVLDHLAAAPPGPALAALEAVMRHDAAAGLQEVRAPVRLLVSDRHPVNLEAISARVPGAEVAVIEGVGHYPMLEKPQEFNRALARIVAGLTAAPPGGR